MWIRVGSKNPTKIEAVDEFFFDLDIPVKPCLSGERIEVEGVEVSSGIAEQPTSIDEAIHGANNRACYAKGDADLGIGIESTIFQAAYTGSGWMNTVVCSIYDGTGDFRIGLGPAFEVPKGAINIVFRDHVDLSEAFFRGEFTDEKRIGYGKGLIHTLTNGKIDRKQYIKQALRMAWIQFDHPKWFGPPGHSLHEGYGIPLCEH